MSKAFLFGASTFGEIAYQHVKDQFKEIYFVDNDRNKWKKIYCNSTVISPEDLLKRREENDTIIITSQYDVEIAKQLLTMGIKEFKVFNAGSTELEYFNYNFLNEREIGIKNGKISLITNNNSGSNTYALYKLIPEEFLNKFEITLINEQKKENNYYLDLIQSQLLIHTHSNNFNPEQYNIQLWHGFPLKTLSFMAKNYSKDVKEKNNKEWSKLDKIISYSSFYNTLMNASFGVDGDKYEITGMPRNDLLLVSDGKKNLSKILNVDLSRKSVVMYLPTFRESIFGEVNGNKDTFDLFNLKDFDWKDFNNYLSENNIILILKFHPSQVKETLNHIKRNNISNVCILKDDDLLDNNLDLYEILNGVDLLITDYSSIYFDYLLLNRPMIFIPIDIDKYRRDRGFLIEPYDFWTPGPKCLTLKKLKTEITKSLENQGYYKEHRETISSIVHRYKDAKSSKRIWELINDLLN